MERSPVMVDLGWTISQYNCHAATSWGGAWSTAPPNRRGASWPDQVHFFWGSPLRQEIWWSTVCVSVGSSKTWAAGCR